MGNNSSSENTNDEIQILQQQILNNQIQIQNLQLTNLQFQNILSNPQLQSQISQNPQLKYSFLTKMLNENSHNMNQQQIQKTMKMLNDLKHNNNNQIRQSHINNINNIQQFETDEQRREREFEAEQQRRRQQFKEQQQRRKTDYQNKLQQIQQQNIDALKLFQLPKKYTFEQLKMSYKKLAMRTHPDRQGGNKDKFQLVTKCYFLLLEKLKTEEQDKQYSELRKGSNDFLKQQASNPHLKKMSKDNFNLRQFNKVFEENKLYDPNDEGYDNWLKTEEDNNVQQPEIFSDKFNIDVFNNSFNNYKSQTSTEIVEYKEPQAMISCNKMNYIELGGENKGDFSNISDKSKDLMYCDLKAAYTTKSNLINPNSVKYKTYKNVDELEKDRSNISYDMTPEQLREYEYMKSQDEIREQQRLDRLRRNDDITAQQYLKVHQSMLGYARGPDLSR